MFFVCFNFSEQRALQIVALKEIFWYGSLQSVSGQEAVKSRIGLLLPTDQQRGQELFENLTSELSMYHNRTIQGLKSEFVARELKCKFAVSLFRFNKEHTL